MVEDEPVAVNERVDLSDSPQMRLSSGKAYARNVGIMSTASERDGTLQVKRDAKGAYRQMHIPVHPR